MIVAAAQFQPIKGDITRNFQQHVRMIHAAAAEQVDVLLFPELSLTGYEPELAVQLALTMQNSVILELNALAREYQMVIIAGAPLRQQHGLPQLSSFVLDPARALFSYSKMNLHPSEERFFAPGATPALFDYQHHRFGLAICADHGNPQHAAALAEAGAVIYLNPVLVSANGYEKNTQQLRTYAKQHRMAVVMANFYGVSGGWETIGKSVIYDESGAVVAQAATQGECLVIGHHSAAGWRGRYLAMN